MNVLRNPAFNTIAHILFGGKIPRELLVRYGMNYKSKIKEYILEKYVYGNITYTL